MIISIDTDADSFASTSTLLLIPLCMITHNYNCISSFSV